MTIYYINADTGDNANAGTVGDPWETLAYAYDNSIADDTIICQDSTASYAFVSDIMSRRTISGEQTDGSGAIFDGGGANLQWRLVGDTIIEKITVTNITFISYHTNIMNAEGEGTEITFNNCVFHTITLSNGTTFNAGIFGANEINVATTTNINNCLFYNNVTNHVKCSIYSFRESNNTANFVGCTVYDGVSIFQMSFGGSNNVAVIKNCILMATSAIPLISFDSGTITPTITYSCINTYTGASLGTGSISSDPLFVDVTTQNFNLRPSSPCIDTGVII